jgi:hypothetical protein
MNKALAAAGLAAAFGLGFLVAEMRPKGAAGDPPPDWVARVGDSYLGLDELRAEMRLRGGTMPGQYQEPEQRRALLDALTYQRALLLAARAEGMEEEPQVRRARDQILANHYLQSTLRQEQARISVSPDEIRAFHGRHAEHYSLPARRRIAMIHVAVPAGAPEAAWEQARMRAAEALVKAQSGNGEVAHFGQVAREYSSDSASRYRGGVIGWLAEGQAERYRYDPAMLEAAYALSEPGQFSPVIDGADGVYVVRLVELEPGRERGLEELSAGIQQRLLQEKLARTEEAFRRRLMERFQVEVREEVLALLGPLSPAARPNRSEPPALPVDEG